MQEISGIRVLTRSRTTSPSSRRCPSDTPSVRVVGRVRTARRRSASTLAAVGDRLREALGLRQQAFGVVARRGDLRAHELGVAIVLRELARSAISAARPICQPPAVKSPQLEVRHRRGVRQRAAAAVRGHQPVDRALQRGRRGRELQADRAQRRIGVRREMRRDLVDLRRDRARRGAAVARRLAADEVVGLDAGRAFVDRGDARVAQSAARRRSPR